MSASFVASIPKFISKTYWFQFRFLKFSATSGLKIQNFLLRSKNLMNDFSYGKRRQSRLVVAEPPERMAAKVASKNRIFPFFSGWVVIKGFWFPNFWIYNNKPYVLISKMSWKLSTAFSSKIMSDLGFKFRKFKTNLPYGKLLKNEFRKSQKRFSAESP